MFIKIDISPEDYAHLGSDYVTFEKEMKSIDFILKIIEQVQVTKYSLENELNSFSKIEEDWTSQNDEYNDTDELFINDNRS